MSGFQSRGINELPLPVTTDADDPLSVTADAATPVASEDFRVFSMLGSILVELRLMNKHLAEITGEEYVCGEE